MRTFIYKIFTVFVLGTLLVACETDIEFKGDETSALMVLNSIITPDSVIKVLISESNFFLSNETKFKYIDNATVNIYVNNVHQEKLKNVGMGLYIGSYTPKLYDTIKITATNGILVEVNSTVSLVGPTQVLSVDSVSKNLKTTVYTSTGESGIDTFGIAYEKDLYFKVKFQDESKIKNYYRILMKEKRYYDDSTSTIFNTSFNSDDLVFGKVSESDIFDDGFSGNSSFEFSDEIFDGKIYELSIYKHYNNFANMYDDDYTDKSVPQLVKNELIVELQSISASWYYHLKTRSAGSNGIDFFREPVQIYSNINGGIGLFGSYSKSIHILTIPLSYQSYDFGWHGGY